MRGACVAVPLVDPRSLGAFLAGALIQRRLYPGLHVSLNLQGSGAGIVNFTVNFGGFGSSRWAKKRIVARAGQLPAWGQI